MLSQTFVKKFISSVAFFSNLHRCINPDFKNLASNFIKEDPEVQICTPRVCLKFALKKARTDDRLLSLYDLTKVNDTSLKKQSGVFIDGGCELLVNPQGDFSLKSLYIKELRKQGFQLLTGKAIMRIVTEMMDKSTQLTRMTLQDISDIRFSHLLKYGYTYYELFNFEYTHFEVPQYFRNLKDLKFPNKYFSDFGFKDEGQNVSVFDFVFALEQKNKRPIDDTEFRRLMHCIDSNPKSDTFCESFIDLIAMHYKPHTGVDMYSLKHRLPGNDE